MQTKWFLVCSFEEENYYCVFYEIHEKFYIVASSAMLALKPCEFICKGQSWNLTGTFLLPQIRFNLHCTLKTLEKENFMRRMNAGCDVIHIFSVMILWFHRKRLSTKIYNLVHDKIHGFDCHYHVTNIHKIRCYSKIGYNTKIQDAPRILFTLLSKESRTFEIYPCLSITYCRK